MAADKEGFLEAMVRIEREAAFRCYERGVEEGKYPDNEQSVMAFAHGWYGTHDYKRAKAHTNNPGSGSILLCVLLFLYIGMVVMSVGMCFYMGNDLNRDGYIMVGLAILAMPLIYLLLRRVRRLTREEQAKFDAEWAQKDA